MYVKSVLNVEQNIRICKKKQKNMYLYHQQYTFALQKEFKVRVVKQKWETFCQIFLPKSALHLCVKRFNINNIKRHSI